MNQSEELARWKTNAWQDPDMVAWYSQQMVSSEGINALKNAVEADILDEFVAGKQLLDVGVGTGRGSLPFASRGLQVTGVDSSAEMLAETRRLAEGVAVDLQVGDVMKLPVGDAAFDTVMSLNVMVHVPQWEKALDEWLRVVRPGGRIVFDIASLDHLNAAKGRNDTFQDLIAAADKAESYGGFTLALTQWDIREYARQRGLNVLRIVPYGALGSDSSYLPLSGFGFMRDQRWWRRLLSWVAYDEKLFAFMFWLERRLLPGLPTAFAGRFMVILVKPDGASSVSRNEATPDTCSERWFAEHAAYRGISVEQLIEELDTYLHHPRNRVLVHYLMRILDELGCLPPLTAFLKPEQVHLYQSWKKQVETDCRAIELMERWPEVVRTPELASHQGVSIASALIYDTLPELLKLERNYRQGDAQ